MLSISSRTNERKQVEPAVFRVEHDDGDIEDLEEPDATAAIESFEQAEAEAEAAAAEAAAAATTVDVSSLKVAELRQELKKLGLSTKGRKAELAARLAGALAGVRLNPMQLGWRGIATDSPPAPTSTPTPINPSNRPRPRYSNVSTTAASKQPTRQPSLRTRRRARGGRSGRGGSDVEYDIQDHVQVLSYIHSEQTLNADRHASTIGKKHNWCVARLFFVGLGVCLVGTLVLCVLESSNNSTRAPVVHLSTRERTPSHPSVPAPAKIGTLSKNNLQPEPPCPNPPYPDGQLPSASAGVHLPH